jgi:hypothetical protein
MKIKFAPTRKLTKHGKRMAWIRFEENFPQWRLKGAGCYGRGLKSKGVSYYPATQLMHFKGIAFWTDDPEAAYKELFALSKPDAKYWLKKKKAEL